ncbi:MAG: hypothetical protein JST23_13355 [Bacteroidetes bacterium]|nr:hypothetical protein [Bacteroidota bacterium]
MKSKIYILISLMFSATLFSCKTVSKLYDKGNYDEAVELAAKKLQKDPNDVKLISMIQDAYQYALTGHENKIRRNNESTNELKWEWLYNEYTALQKMYNAINKVPEINNIIQPTDYSSYIATYSDKAADVRYSRGLSLMNGYNKKNFQDAYNEFKTALKFRPNDRDAIVKMDEAYQNAVTNIIILPLQQPWNYNYSTYNNNNINYGAQNFENELLHNLQFYGRNNFVKFYNDWDARRDNIRVDEVLDTRLNTMDIGRYVDNRSTRKVTKEVVIREIVYKPDSIVKVYGTVTAEITTTKRQMISQGNMQVSLRDADGRWLWNDNFWSTNRWETEFATYTGDERALSDTDRQLINRRTQLPPPENEISRNLINDLQNKALTRIKEYFNRY